MRGCRQPCSSRRYPGGRRWAAGQSVRGPAPTPPFCPQYFADAADAAAWLLEQQSALESTSCGPDQASAEALLLGHLRLEPTLWAFGAELQQLDQQARAAAARASLTVCVGGGRVGKEKRPIAQASNTKCAAPCPPWPHRG